MTLKDIKTNLTNGIEPTHYKTPYLTCVSQGYEEM